MTISKNTRDLLEELSVIRAFPVLDQNRVQSIMKRVREILSDNQIDSDSLNSFRDDNGNTLLHIACKSLTSAQYSLEIINLLLEKGVNPTIKNQQGQNSLMVLCEDAFSAICRAVEKKVDGLNGSNIKGESYSSISVGLPIGKIFFENNDDDRDQFNYYLDDYKSTIKERNEGLEGKFKYHYAISDHFTPDEIELKKFQDNIKERLIEATVANATNAIDRFLDMGVNLNEKDNLGRLAINILQEASLGESIPNYLISKGANKYDILKHTPDYAYLLDRKDRRNICRENGEWSEISRAISQAIINRNLNKYPYAHLNDDNSISLFIDKDIQDNTFGVNANEHLRNLLPQSSIINQLEFQCLDHGFDIMGKDILTTEEHLDNIEYKINITPNNLDSILKLNPIYAGYRNDGSVLRLNKELLLKKDSIMLFPVYQINDTEFNVRAAGCQLYEMPTLQLMGLLPNYKSEILPTHQKAGFRFHWIPKEVGEYL